MTGGVKNKIIVTILYVAMFLIAACSYNAFFKVSAANLSDNAVIVLSGETDGEKVSVNAVLIQNTGLNGLTLEISYDTDAMTLINVEKGAALSSLEYMTTNVDTEQGYGIIPFKINWSGDENDASTGRLFNMEFSVKDNIQDGKYTVTLKAEKNKSATYILDGDAHTKNVLINGVQVEIKGSKPQSVEEETTGNNSNILLWVSVSVAVLAVSGLVVLTIFKIKGKKSWTKI